jgi:hypothetical protein
MVEGVHRQIKDALLSKGVQPQLVWPPALSPRGTLGGTQKRFCGLVELVYGSAIPLPGHFPSQDEMASPVVLSPFPTQLPYAQAEASVPQAIECVSHVYVRRGFSGHSLAPLYSGPYKVLKCKPKSVNIAAGHRVETVSIDRIKPHQGGPVVATKPPARGHPLT